MSGKYFPIQTKTACQLKWNWSTIRLYTGYTSSCHRVDSDLITIDSFDSFHNTPKKIDDRNLMLQGQWPTGGCEYCKKIEDAGGMSDRQLHLAIPNLVPPELESNITAVEVTPRIVEIYFDNVCNMSCIYCWDGFSSKIQQENIKFGRFEKAGVIIDNRAIKVPDIQALTDKFWNWMSQNHTTISRLHVLGGEPFYQRQFDQCLDFFEQYSSPTMELNVISNLMIDNKKLKEIINRIRSLVKQRKLARFDLTASIDCFGPEQEYVRYGLNLNQWRENFEFLVSQKWITLHINQTLSGLTLNTIPDLLQYVNNVRKNRKVGHFFSTVEMSQDFLHPGIFGPGFFDFVFLQILSNMPTDTDQQKQSYKYMQGIQAQINSCTKDQKKINQLAVFLDEIDRRRGLNWKNTFSWLTKEVTYVV